MTNTSQQSVVLTTEQHTPGPWGAQLDLDTIEIFVPAAIGRKVIAEIQTGFTEPFESQQRANARLIAAAPDLLALLKELIDIEGPQPGHIEWARKVQAAIAKAEGRS